MAKLQALKIPKKPLDNKLVAAPITKTQPLWVGDRARGQMSTAADKLGSWMDGIDGGQIDKWIAGQGAPTSKAAPEQKVQLQNEHKFSDGSWEKSLSDMRSWMDTTDEGKRLDAVLGAMGKTLKAPAKPIDMNGMYPYIQNASSSKTTSKPDAGTLRRWRLGRNG